MANKLISKATIASILFSTLLAPQTLATTTETLKETKPHTETITTSTLQTVPHHTAEGKVFVDSYNQTGLYTIVKHQNNQPNLTIVLGEESLKHVNTNEDTLYLYPTKDTWTDHIELNAHWIQQLLEEKEFTHYTNITWVGHGQAADFIAHLIANNPTRIHNTTLSQGGKYHSYKLTQATYDQLLNMNITIKNTNPKTAKEIAQSYTTHGFQNVTFETQK